MAIFYDYKIQTGENNMQIDSDLLDFAIKENLTQPILRLYGWSPACVSLGRNQPETNINKDLCKKLGIDLTRRLTGGRALLHDDELTYSFICPTEFLQNKDSVILSYKEISWALIEGMDELGITLEFPENKKAQSKFDYCMSISTGADLSYKNKKLIGSAQFRKQGYILQHGSILISYDKEKIESIFNEKVDENSITAISEIDKEIMIKEIAESIKSGFSKYFNLRF